MDEIAGNKYLGTLCLNMHDWKDTGKTLRYKKSIGCVQCGQDYMRSPKRLKYSREYKRKPERLKYSREYNSRPHIKKEDNRRNGIARDTLSDSYIKKLLKGPTMVSQELIEAKRLHIKIHRLIREGVR